MGAIVAANSVAVHSSDAGASATDAGTLAGRGTKRAAAPTSVSPTSVANPSDTGRGPAWSLTLSPRSNVSLLQASLNALRPSLSDDLANTLTEQLQKTSEALTKLDQARSSLVANSKGAAEQKLDRARKMLQMLRMLGGDPATIAKQAKAIAQEIKAAAREYSAALKSEADGGAPAAAATAAMDSTSPLTDTPAETGAAAFGEIPTAVAAEAVVVKATSPERSGDRGDGSAAGRDPASQSASSQAAALPADPEAVRQQTVQAYQDAANNAAAKANRDRGEQQVLEKFKDAAREVKQIIEEAVRKLRAKQPADPDAHAAVQAGVSLDHAVRELGDVMQIEPGNGSVDISISLGSVAAAAPTLDIKT